MAGGSSSTDAQTLMASSDALLQPDASTPRWVKVFGLIAIVTLLAFVLLHLAGGGPRVH